MASSTAFLIRQLGASFSSEAEQHAWSTLLSHAGRSIHLPLLASSPAPGASYDVDSAISDAYASLRLHGYTADACQLQHCVEWLREALPAPSFASLLHILLTLSHPSSRFTPTSTLNNSTGLTSPLSSSTRHGMHSEAISKALRGLFSPDSKPSTSPVSLDLNSLFMHNIQALNGGVEVEGEGLSAEDSDLLFATRCVIPPSNDFNRSDVMITTPAVKIEVQVDAKAVLQNDEGQTSSPRQTPMHSRCELKTTPLHGPALHPLCEEVEVHCRRWMAPQEGRHSHDCNLACSLMHALASLFLTILQCYRAHALTVGSTGGERGHSHVWGGVLLSIHACLLEIESASAAALTATPACTMSTHGCACVTVEALLNVSYERLRRAETATDLTCVYAESAEMQYAPPHERALAAGVCASVLHPLLAHAHSCLYSAARATPLTYHTAHNACAPALDVACAWACVDADEWRCARGHATSLAHADAALYTSVIAATRVDVDSFNMAAHDGDAAALCMRVWDRLIDHMRRYTSSCNDAHARVADRMHAHLHALGVRTRGSDDAVTRMMLERMCDAAPAAAHADPRHAPDTLARLAQDALTPVHGAAYTPSTGSRSRTRLRDVMAAAHSRSRSLARTSTRSIDHALASAASQAPPEGGDAYTPTRVRDAQIARGIRAARATAQQAAVSAQEEVAAARAAELDRLRAAAEEAAAKRVADKIARIAEERVAVRAAAAAPQYVTGELMPVYSDASSDDAGASLTARARFALLRLHGDRLRSLSAPTDEPHSEVAAVCVALDALVSLGGVNVETAVAIARDLSLHDWLAAHASFREKGSNVPFAVDVLQALPELETLLSADTAARVRARTHVRVLEPPGGTPTMGREDAEQRTRSKRHVEAHAHEGSATRALLYGGGGDADTAEEATTRGRARVDDRPTHGEAIAVVGSGVVAAERFEGQAEHSASTPASRRYNGVHDVDLLVGATDDFSSEGRADDTAASSPVAAEPAHLRAAATDRSSALHDAAAPSPTSPVLHAAVQPALSRVHTSPAAARAAPVVLDASPTLMEAVPMPQRLSVVIAHPMHSHMRALSHGLVYALLVTHDLMGVVSGLRAHMLCTHTHFWSRMAQHFAHTLLMPEVRVQALGDVIPRTAREIAGFANACMRETAVETGDAALYRALSDELQDRLKTCATPAEATVAARVHTRTPPSAEYLPAFCYAAASDSSDSMHGSLRSLAALQPQFKLPAPALAAILSPASMHIYSAVHAHMLRLHCIQAVLDEAWLRTRHASVLRLVNAARHEMAAFLRACIGFYTRIVDDAAAAFACACIKEGESVEGLRAAHDGFMQTLCNLCFIHPHTCTCTMEQECSRARTAGAGAAALQRALDCVLACAHAILRACDDSETMQGDRMGTVERTHAQFRGRVHVLITAVRARAAGSGELARVWAQLTEALDMNDWHARTYAAGGFSRHRDGVPSA